MWLVRWLIPAMYGILQSLTIPVILHYMIYDALMIPSSNQKGQWKNHHLFIVEFPIQTYIYRRFSCSSWISHPQIPPNFPKPKLDRFDVTWLGFVGAETMASKATMDGEADTAHWTWESSGWICIWDIWLYIHHYIYTVYHILYIYYKWLRMIVSLGLCLAKFDKD